MERQALPNCQLINGYGPTENTTFTCCFPISEMNRAGSSIPIGRPIANTRVYILDSQQEPVPIGVWGELYAGGDGVARGYHNSQVLTDERFLSNPFGPRENPGRLYRTGDVARWLPSGNIEFWVAWTIRSSYAGIGLNWAKSKPYSANMLTCGKPS
ncbi:AMP-binding protein [Chloroflexi bacterium TSY]|nr:AMP-binding protein [Chloroflexi bacterium TSY]